LVFAPGQTRATIPVTIYGDTNYESQDNVRVTLTGATNAIVTANGSEPSRYSYYDLNIENDDAP
jgi:hypothetical protein